MVERNTGGEREADANLGLDGTIDTQRAVCLEAEAGHAFVQGIGEGLVDDVLLEEDEELEVGTGDGDGDVEGRTGVIKNGFEPGLQRARAGEGGAARSVDDWRELIHPAPDAVSDLHETFQTIADDGDFFRELRGVEQLVQNTGQTEQPLQGVVH